MTSQFNLPAVLVFAIGAAAQSVSWCKAEGCDDCPSSIVSDGPGYPQCVIYDSNTVFGGQGFEEGTGKIKFNVWGNFVDPCDGAPGSYMVRSPATLTAQGCGNLIYHTENAECSGQLSLEDTFMIQFCCGNGDCTSAGVPWGKRDGGGMQGGYLQFENGTTIEPLAVGSPPDTRRVTTSVHQRRCEGYTEGSYVADTAPYLKTFDTVIVANGILAQKEAYSITVKYDQSVSKTTSFSVSVGDPFGIISATVGFEFTEQKTTGFETQVPIPANQAGRVGWTPVFQCTSGTLKDCSGNQTPVGESCTPYMTAEGFVHGDYSVVQT